MSCLARATTRSRAGFETASRSTQPDASTVFSSVVILRTTSCAAARSVGVSWADARANASKLAAIVLVRIFHFQSFLTTWISSPALTAKLAVSAAV